MENNRLPSSTHSHRASQLAHHLLFSDRAVGTRGAQGRGRVRNRQGATLHHVRLVGEDGSGLSATLRCHLNRDPGVCAKNAYGTLAGRLGMLA